MILVSNLTYRKINRRKIKNTAEKVLKLIGLEPSDWYLEINFVSSREIAALHKKFFNKSGPTTVITLTMPKNFILAKGDGGDVFMAGGEVYLCLSEIRTSGLSWEYCLVHGLLHLAGFDHQTPKQERVMVAKEIEICAKMKL